MIIVALKQTCYLQGLLPPLDAPHHLRKHEWAPYREGKIIFPFFGKWRGEKLLSSNPYRAHKDFDML